MLMRSSVYAALKSDIIACRLPPGAELREPDIATRYGVSRSPVRDAMLRLEADGLVQIVPRQFYRVAPISLRDATDLFHMRRLLEPQAARDAAQNADETTLALLKRAAEHPPGADFIDSNRRFHCMIAGAASNRRLAATCVDCIEQSDRLVRVSLGQIEGRQPGRLVGEHLAIVAAIVNRDGRAAAKLLRTHIDAAEARVLAALRRQPIVTN
ncbi:MAG: GntR family transcriptional regulator [Rhodospirillales bacterium 20-64-7]|nr:MAG: GntR family transcriptional regulator [Rhodospirillales bacterium 20-64-7]